MKSVISFQRVTFEWPNGETIFRNICFSLDQSNTALIGSNGIGKSTLCELAAGRFEPTMGFIHRSVDSSVNKNNYQPQNMHSVCLSIDEFLHSQHYVWFRFSETLLEGLDRGQCCNQLSGGQWMRVRLAAAIGDHYVILDEPTNDLDKKSREIFYNFLKQLRFCSLIISHDRECLMFCGSILELTKQGISKYGMQWTEYQDVKRLERSAIKKDLERAEKECELAQSERNEKIQRQDKRNQQGKKQAAKNGMPKILVGSRKRRAQVSTGKLDVGTLKILERKVTEVAAIYNELKVDPVMYFELLNLSIPEQKLVVEAKEFNIFFDRWIFLRNLNFTYRGNIRLSIKGGNGAGKSSLLKAILGHQAKTTGELRKGDLNIFYIDQNCQQLDPARTVLENIHSVSSLEETEIRNNLAQFLFFKEKVHQKVGTLSGGERLRATLALAFLQSRRPELLMLDEPNNNLDLANIQFLEQLIQVFKGAVVVVSHDTTFIKNCKLDQELVL